MPEIEGIKFSDDILKYFEHQGKENVIALVYRFKKIEIIEYTEKSNKSMLKNLIDAMQEETRKEKDLCLFTNPVYKDCHKKKEENDEKMKVSNFCYLSLITFLSKPKNRMSILTKTVLLPYRENCEYLELEELFKKYDAIKFDRNIDVEFWETVVLEYYNDVPDPIDLDNYLDGRCAISNNIGSGETVLEDEN